MEFTPVADASGTESETSEGSKKMSLCLNNDGLRVELQGQCKNTQNKSALKFFWRAKKQQNTLLSTVKRSEEVEHIK